MGVRNAGKTIREARIKAGLTQEQLSEGVCSVLSLSRIENGSAGVSPVTFQALMAHAGAPCEVYPIFAGRTDFECFYSLNRARFYMDSWQLDYAFKELNKIEDLHFANNKLYYQEWLSLYGRLLVRSGCKNHSAIYDLFSMALHITRPQIDYSDFRHLLLSIVEIELLIDIAQELLYLGKCDLCYSICSQIASYLTNAEIDYLKKDYLYAEYAIVYTKYLLEKKDYKEALAIADSNRHKMVQNSEDSPLLELTFLTSLGYYYTGEVETAYTYFKNAFYAAHSIESCYATIYRNYVLSKHLFSLDDCLAQMNDIPLIVFPIKKAINTLALTDGTYDFFSPDILTIGRLIHELRTEQGISQIVLCQGLCSKSKLSKIENDALQPDVFLTEALLQRLGISECGFTFWGSERESRLYELKFKLTHTRLLTNEQIENYLHQFHSLITKKDNILMQRYTFDCNLLSSSPEECIQNLHTALAYTLPDFDIRFIYNYHLSHSELSILNNIGFQYRNIDGNKSKLYFAKLLDYLSVHSLDILFINSVFLLTLYKYEHSLYTQHHYHEAADLFTSSNHQLLKGNLATFGYFLFYYCQCLAECQQYESATKFAHYACSIQELYELNANSEVLKKDFLKDFSINII
jgi:transcriptional regulator with XRE-family HTH domain